MGCDEQGCGISYSSLPVLSGCPGDNETFLVGNAIGGTGPGKYGVRKWSDIKVCISASAKPPLIGVVDGGGEDDPVSGGDTFQSDKFIGLGSTNAGKVLIFIDNIPQTNFGTNISFILDNVTGLLDISPNKWFAGSSLYVDLNQ